MWRLIAESLFRPVPLIASSREDNGRTSAIHHGIAVTNVIVASVLIGKKSAKEGIAGLPSRTAQLKGGPVFGGLLQIPNKIRKSRHPTLARSPPCLVEENKNLRAWQGRKWVRNS
jgi:hypothetical protein